jgi:hypothetical protein
MAALEEEIERLTMANLQSPGDWSLEEGARKVHGNAIHKTLTDTHTHRRSAGWHPEWLAFDALGGCHGWRQPNFI